MLIYRSWDMFIEALESNFVRTMHTFVPIICYLHCKFVDTLECYVGLRHDLYRPENSIGLWRKVRNYVDKHGRDGT